MTPDLRDIQRAGNVQVINGMVKKKKKKHCRAVVSQNEIKKSTIDIWNPQCLWLCNKSYAPGACTSVDAIRLLFDSYSKIQALRDGPMLMPEWPCKTGGMRRWNSIVRRRRCSLVFVLTHPGLSFLFEAKTMLF